MTIMSDQQDPIESIKSLVEEVVLLRQELASAHHINNLYASWLRLCIDRNSGKIQRSREECANSANDKRSIMFGACEIEFMP